MPRLSTVRLLAAGTALATIATPAFAQDELRNDYTGFYIAGSIGAAVQNNDKNDTVLFDTNRDGDFDNTVRNAGGVNVFGPVAAPGASGGFCSGAGLSNRLSGGCSDDDDDQEYAVKIGYDQQLGTNFVAGVLIEGSMTDAEDSTTAFSTTPARYQFDRSLDYAISARGRLGYTPDGSGLFYVTGGPSYAKLDHTFSTTNTVNTFEQRGGDKVWGYQFGGGAEIGIANGLGIGLEYLYSKYDDEDYFVAIGPSNPVNPFGTGTNFRPSDNDFDFHSLRANLIYKF